MNMSDPLESQTRTPVAFAEALGALLEGSEAIQERWRADSGQLSAELAAMAPNEGIRCSKGCGACCYFPLIPATAGEAFLTINRLLASGVEMQDLRKSSSGYAERYIQAARAAGGFPFTDSQRAAIFEKKLPCPLFSKTAGSEWGGACSAYPHRPLICDYFHSLDDPAKCALKAPHRSFQPLHERGEQALDELRALERKLFGRSALGHLPLLLAALLEPTGLQLFLSKVELGDVAEADRDDSTALLDFQFYIELLSVVGYDITDADLASIAAAQAEVGMAPEF